MAKRKPKPSLEEFATASVVEKVDDRELVAALEHRGWIVTRDKPTERQVKIDGPAPKKGRVRFGLVSDTHLGHKHQQITYWRDFTEQARTWGAEFMLHAGDLVDGGRMHRDQEFELFQHGATAQGKYASKTIPRLEGKGRTVLPTYMIGGNHDGSFFNDAGANVFDTIVSGRPDLHFLGAPAAMFHVGPLRIYLMHPDGGPSYARSYKPQKIVEQFAPDEKPHMVFMGHWHIAVHLPAYRNVEAIALPCFQSQTAYLKRKGLAPVVGGLLIEAEYSEQGLVDFQTRWRIYRNPLPNDYP